jgi:hypothetical protein
MPYQRIGKTTYKVLPSGHREKVGTASSIANAKKQMNLLRAIEHNPGWKPGYARGAGIGRRHAR